MKTISLLGLCWEYSNATQIVYISHKIFFKIFFFAKQCDIRWLYIIVVGYRRTIVRFTLSM